MSILNLNGFASMMATYVRQKLAGVHRAAILVRCTTDGSVLAAVFGNDNFIGDARTRREVDLVRRQLKESAIQELAFGLSRDGHSWALLVRTDTHDCTTDLGRAFRTEMLRASLDEAVWAAWQSVSGEMPPADRATPVIAPTSAK